MKTITPLLLALATVEPHHGTWYQMMLPFSWKCLVHYLLITNIPTFSRTWIRLKGLIRLKLNWRFQYSSCQNLKEEARERFKINEMLFHCLDTWKFIKLFATESEKWATTKFPSFSRKAVLVSSWWYYSKNSDFTFVFTTTNGQEDFTC